MKFMLSSIHEIIIAPSYTTQKNSWNDISKAVNFFEFDIELYRVVGCEVKKEKKEIMHCNFWFSCSYQQ